MRYRIQNTHHSPWTGGINSGPPTIHATRLRRAVCTPDLSRCTPPAQTNNTRLDPHGAHHSSLINGYALEGSRTYIARFGRVVSILDLPQYSLEFTAYTLNTTNYYEGKTAAETLVNLGLQ